MAVVAVVAVEDGAGAEEGVEGSMVALGAGARLPRAAAAWVA